MKQKFVSYFKEKWQDYASFILMIIIIFGMMYHLMELSNCELNIPLFIWVEMIWGYCKC